MSLKSTPGRYIVAYKDRTFRPQLQRFVAQGVGVFAFVDSSRVPNTYWPHFVRGAIRTAVSAVHRLTQHRVNGARSNETAGPLDDEPAQTSAEFASTYGAIVNALTAAIINAQAASQWLSARPPNLEEVQRSLNAIANDGARAAGLMVQLRAPIKKYHGG